MENLKAEMNEALDIYDANGITDENQRYIISNGGVYFNFSYGTDRRGINRKFDPLKFARFLKFCQSANIGLDANKLVTANDYDKLTMSLVHSFDEIDKLAQEQTKKLKRQKNIAK